MREKNEAPSLHDDSDLAAVVRSTSALNLVWALPAPGCAEFLRSHVHTYLTWPLCFLELVRTSCFSSNKRKIRASYLETRFLLKSYRHSLDIFYSLKQCSSSPFSQRLHTRLFFLIHCKGRISKDFDIIRLYLFS